MTDILSSLFGNIPFDIQEKIYNEVLIIQDKEKNMRYFTGYVLGELKYNWQECDGNFDRYMKTRMICIYQHYKIGKRTTYKNDNGCTIHTIYDKLYYDNLDFLIMCDLETGIYIEDDVIFWYFRLKDCYSGFLKSYIMKQRDELISEYDGDFTLEDGEDLVLYENFYGFRYQKEGGVDPFGSLYDFCRDHCCEDVNDLDRIDMLILDEIINNYFEDISNEELTLLLTKFTKGKIF